MKPVSKKDEKGRDLARGADQSTSTPGAAQIQRSLLTDHPLSRIEKIQQCLAVLNPSSCQIEDDSALHIGHAGAAGGAGHFRVTIVSDKFNNLKLIERHRLVYDSVGDLMQTEIHALVITALAPAEKRSP